jgi:uncharacterized protein YkwD
MKTNECFGAVARAIDNRLAFSAQKHSIEMKSSSSLQHTIFFSTL